MRSIHSTRKSRITSFRFSRVTIIQNCRVRGILILFIPFLLLSISYSLRPTNGHQIQNLNNENDVRQFLITDEIWRHINNDHEAELMIRRKNTWNEIGNISIVNGIGLFWVSLIAGQAPYHNPSDAAMLYRKRSIEPDIPLACIQI